MANTKIRGITIEIGGDTTKLTKALDKVTTELKGTQNGLKDVNKLLKFDPSNVELLRQKQAYLNDAIKDTEAKLASEKKLLEDLKNTDGFDKNSEQARALERQIAADEKALENLKKELKDFGSVTAQQLKAAGEEFKKLGERLEGIGQKVSGVGKSLTTHITAPVAALGTAAVKTTADFDTAMSRVQALSGATGDEFEKLRNRAREMGATTRYSATEVADAMQYMALAGWDTMQIYEGIPGVLNLAAASGEDLSNVSDILTDSMTAFGMGAEEAGRAADILAETMASSNTTVGLMGETFKYAANVAGPLGYSMEDVALATGLMANAGIKGSMAGTTLRNIMQRMSKPTKEAQMAMTRLGVSLADDEGRMYSFREILEQLRKSFGNINMPIEEFYEAVAHLDENLENGYITEKKYEEEVVELAKQAYGAEGAEKARAAAMLGGTRAMSGLLAIVSATEEDYNALAAAIDNSSQAFEEGQGAAERMANIMLNNLGGQLTILKSQLQELAISFGDMLVPLLREGVTFLQGLVDKLNSLDEEQRKTILQIAAVVAALGPVLLIGGKIIAGIGTAIKIIGTLITVGGTLVGFLSGPFGLAIGLAVTAIAALIAIGVTLYKNWDTIKEWAGELKNALLEKWDAIKAGVTEKVTAMKTAVTEKFDAIKDSITEKINAAKDAVHNAIEKIKSFLNFHWELPHLAMPHFSVSGSMNPYDWFTQGVPHISVEWYKKAYQNPIMFTSPTVLSTPYGYKGFGDGAGAEVVLGLNKLRELAGSGETNIQINVYGAEGQDVTQLASEIERRLVKMQKQRTAVWA